MRFDGKYMLEELLNPYWRSYHNKQSPGSATIIPF